MNRNIIIQELQPDGYLISGLIPSFLDPWDERPAAQQFNERYAHGGGWRKFEGFKADADFHIQYPGDSAMSPVVLINLRDERIFIYPHAWVMIVQSDGSWEICRMD